MAPDYLAELARSLPVFQIDLQQLSVAAEEPLDVLFADMIAQPAHVYTRHPSS